MSESESSPRMRSVEPGVPFPAEEPAVPPDEVKPPNGRIEPLSAVLARMFAADTDGHMSVNQLLLSLERRGPLALIILLCLPFMTPVSLPGISNVFGAVIMYLSGRMLLGRLAVLPASLGGRRIHGPMLSKVVRAGLKALQWLERGIHPRPSPWVTSAAARRLNSGLIFYGALLLALPLPPTIPCSNLFPAAAIILIATSMAEGDGTTIWLGYAVMFGATMYLGVMVWFEAAAIVYFVEKCWRFLVEWRLG